MMIITESKIDFSMEDGVEEFLLSGPRGDFMYNRVDKVSMSTFFSEFYDFLKAGDFSPSQIEPSQREELV